MQRSVQMGGDSRRALERALEWLRPLVETKTWDYCVVWELGDDPSRFIEWMGCCCGGGGGGSGSSGGDHINVKEERREHHLHPLCRDAYFPHPVRTKACEALAHLPSSMPLYSGVHGEVVISTQPKWLIHANTLESNPSNDSIGTRVLIPVVGGLIELFVAKLIPKDQKILEFVTAQYNVYLEQAAVTIQSNTTVSFDEHLQPFLDKYLHNWPPPLPRTQPRTYPSFEGSSTSSNPSNEHQSLDSNSGHVSQSVSLKQSIHNYLGSKKRKCNENLSKQEIGFVSDCGKHVAEKDNLKVSQRPEREQFHSKNLTTERNRRSRIKDGLFALRALVPKISKMDRISILGDAIDYIEELQKTVKKLQNELREMAEEDYTENNGGLEIPKLYGVHGNTRYSPATEQKQGSSCTCENKQMEVQVEVNQIGTRDFLLKFFSEQKQGGFERLMEALNSLGIQVIDANVTTFNGKVLNILKVEAYKKEVQPKKLRESLIELTG